MRSHIFSKFSVVVFGASLIGYPLTTIAGLEGSQRLSVRQSTYKSCMASAGQSAPQLTHSERQRWCACYSDQIVDNVTPNDINEFSGNGAPTPRMRKIAGDAIEYCQKKLY